MPRRRRRHSFYRAPIGYFFNSLLEHQVLTVQMISRAAPHTQMAHGSEKYRSRRNRARVKELFWREWDPIGIKDAPGAEDEYDRYADKAYVMLMDEERTAEEIAAYLYDISSEHMGLGKSQLLKELAIDIASKLVALKPTFELESNDPF